MCRFLTVLFIGLFSGSLTAENLMIRTDLFSTPGENNRKNVNELLNDERAQKLFSGKILCTTSADSSFSFFNLYEFQKSGFSIKLTPAFPKDGRKNYRIETNLNWNFAEDGPFLASGTESFHEGTVFLGVRHLIPGRFSPLGITESRNANRSYIPAITFSREDLTGRSIFRRNSKWEIRLIISEPEKEDKIITATPVYHRGNFPAKNKPGELQCRIYNHSGICVMNLLYCTEKGLRENGEPVLEQIMLSICFEAPEKGSEILLADLSSFCADEQTAFGKLPSKGGKESRCQVILYVK